MSYDLSCNAFFKELCNAAEHTWLSHPRRLCFFSPENSKLCLLYAGYRIFRGYKELCNAAERLPDVTHVVFVVHGVGGNMDESTIGRNAAFLLQYMIHFKFHKFTVLFPKINSWTACKLYAAPAYYYAVSLSKMLDCML